VLFLGLTKAASYVAGSSVDEKSGMLYVRPSPATVYGVVSAACKRACNDSAIRALIISLVYLVFPLALSGFFSSTLILYSRAKPLSILKA